MNLEPKVADFGLAKLCSRENNVSVNTHFRGTRGYAAPEMWKPYPVTHKCDVYSFGILLFEIVGRRRHFDDNYSESQQWFPKWTWDMFENNELSVMLSFCGIEEKDKEKAERMLKVALWCVQYSPNGRPSMSTVVKMLEGEIEISPPSFPFQNLVSVTENDIRSSDAALPGVPFPPIMGKKVKGHISIHMGYFAILFSKAL
ncbi:LEAF RUST 10 DISEASE-RESISTANCE LOCUS RECEPTOR-LIKE PROTEIN KINASE-like 2.3, partial [Mucuna pruriens]